MPSSAVASLHLAGERVRREPLRQRLRRDREGHVAHLGARPRRDAPSCRRSRTRRRRCAARARARAARPSTRGQGYGIEQARRGRVGSLAARAWTSGRLRLRRCSGRSASSCSSPCRAARPRSPGSRCSRSRRSGSSARSRWRSGSSRRQRVALGAVAGSLLAAAARPSRPPAGARHAARPRSGARSGCRSTSAASTASTSPSPRAGSSAGCSRSTSCSARRRRRCSGGCRAAAPRRACQRDVGLAARRLPRVGLSLSLALDGRPAARPRTCSPTSSCPSRC